MEKPERRKREYRKKRQEARTVKQMSKSPFM
jgi:hypothetical protein